MFVKRGIEVFAPQPTKTGLVNPMPAFTGTLQRYDLVHGERGFIGYKADIEASKPLEYFSAPRILLRQVLSRKLRLQAVFVEDAFLTNQSVQSLIPVPEKCGDVGLELLLAILNSRLLSWYFVHFNSVARRDDFPKIIIQQTRELPVPKLADTKQKHLAKRAGELALRMQAVFGKAESIMSPQQKTALERQIEATDREIDQLVYQLYGLTDAEIRIVEGSMG